ncbi:MAG TPA: phosphoglycolate phosphatase [Caulobacteraceae bacterium]|nr:phosphoglycolate phosphatase [Caulobacteraceae bacterium]
MKQSALLFDLDGTLVNSVPDLAMAANRLLAELGRAPLEIPDIARMVGDGVAALVERVLAARGVEEGAAEAALPRFVALYEKDAATLTRPYPGVEAVLGRFAGEGVRLAVCTNKPEAATRRVLEGVGLARFFSVVLGGDSLPQRKPDPAPLLAALHRLGAAPGMAAMVGDHRNDVLAAHGAGVSTVFARYGYGLATLGALRPDAVIDSFGALPGALEVLSSQSSVVSRR